MAKKKKEPLNDTLQRSPQPTVTQQFVDQTSQPLYGPAEQAVMRGAPLPFAPSNQAVLRGDPATVGRGQEQFLGQMPAVNAPVYGGLSIPQAAPSMQPTPEMLGQLQSIMQRTDRPAPVAPAAPQVELRNNVDYMQPSYQTELRDNRDWQMPGSSIPPFNDLAEV